ncbi:MAG: amino-acid N-acetyltransferase [Puniceicoccaceae bacterium]|nr:MAG: amino-acid N-acetyltransferase [Puniceicoccaceae bacterium]
MTLPAAASPIKPADLRGILQYVPRFQGQIFIVALDGRVVADENLSNLLLEVAVLRSLGIRVVIVHGIGQQLRALSEQRGIPISDTDGSGATDAATLDLAIRAAARVSHQILEGLTQGGLKCAITNAVRAAPVGIVRGRDHFHSGKVDRIDRACIEHLMAGNILPILQPIGFDRDGRSLRINSDLLATEAAVALEATKIIFLTPAPGLEIQGEVRRDIAVEDLRLLLENPPDAISPAQQSKARHALQAIDRGVPRVHLVDGRMPDSLLNEIFSNEGVGTLIHGRDYQQIRRATRKDIRLIHNLTRHAVKRDELLNRSLVAVEKAIDRFYVHEIDENLIACIQLNTFEEDPATVEIGSLYVLPYYQGRGLGQKMVEFAVHEARRRGARHILALSTQSFSFFTSICGFEEGTPDLLPPSRRRIYDQSQRHSRILVKTLA